jgi:hypothetical protein
VRSRQRCPHPDLQNGPVRSRLRRLHPVRSRQRCPHPDLQSGPVRYPDYAAPIRCVPDDVVLVLTFKTVPPSGAIATLLRLSRRRCAPAQSEQLLQHWATVGQAMPSRRWNPPGRPPFAFHPSRLADPGRSYMLHPRCDPSASALSPCLLPHFPLFASACCRSPLRGHEVTTGIY